MNDKDSTYKDMLEVVKDYMRANELHKNMSDYDVDYMKEHLHLILETAINDALSY